MHVPILSMSHPEEKFWLTDEHAASPTGQPVLVDATGHIYRPTDLPGPILVKEGTCNQVFYDAAYRAGYQVVWID